MSFAFEIVYCTISPQLCSSAVTMARFYIIYLPIVYKQEPMTRDYPGDWNDRRKRVYKRDDHECQNCGDKGSHRGDAEIHAHHVVPKSKGGSHRESNLITVCKNCHHAIHGDEVVRSTNKKTSDDSKARIEEFLGDMSQLSNQFNFTEMLNWTSQYCYTTSNIYDGQRSELKQHREYKKKLLNKCYKSNRFIESLEEVSTGSLPHEIAEDHSFLVQSWRQWATTLPRIIQDTDEVIQLLVGENGENTCPVCGSDTITSEAHCKNCKVELEALYFAGHEKKIYRKRDYNEKLNKLNQAV